MGFLDERLTANELADALKRIHQGGSGVTSADYPPSVDFDLGDWPGRDQGLSAREAEVIALITQGLANGEIAARTYMSINTIKKYIRSAYRKMGVDSRTRAVLWGVDHGFPPGPHCSESTRQAALSLGCGARSSAGSRGSRQ